MNPLLLIIVGVLILGWIAIDCFPKGSKAQIITITSVYLSLPLFSFFVDVFLGIIAVLFWIPIVGLGVSHILLKDTRAGKVIRIISVCWLMLAIILSLLFLLK